MHHHHKGLLRKSYASMVEIGDSVVAGLRCYPTVWRDFILRCKTINLGIGGDQVENFLWHINDTVLPKSIRSVVIQCDTNNIDTNSSNEISHSLQRGTKSQLKKQSHLKSPFPPEMTLLKSQQNFQTCQKLRFPVSLPS